MKLDIGDATAAAADHARNQLSALARRGGEERSMAGIAAGAIFQEALLSALRSRIAELKSVAK